MGEGRIEFIVKRRSLDSCVIRVPKKFREELRRIRVALVVVVPLVTEEDLSQASSTAARIEEGCTKSRAAPSSRGLCTPS